ncbi:ABC transporter permease [Candidatus Woesearchaeota archaeon]|nr:ABC transporter permease [Candidatus Woesearchaeota archaeon]
MIKDYFSLALKSVRQRKLRSWLTMIGIFIGIAAVVALISLSQGLKQAVADQFQKLGSDKLVIQASGSGFGPPGTAVTSPLTKKDKEAIGKVKGVDLVVGRLIRQVKVGFNNQEIYTYVTSLPHDIAELALVIEANDYHVSEGHFFEKEKVYEAIIGSQFSQNAFDKKINLRNRLTIQNQQFQIIGILKKSGNPQRDNYLVLPEETLREIINIKEDYDVLVVKVKAGENINLVTDNINKQLRKTRNVEKGEEDFTLQSPQNLLNTLNNIILIIQGVLVGIAAISLVVGGVGIMNTMYTAVLERTKEIGLLKAIGATNQEVMSLFLIESGMLGLFGGIIGVILGYLISKSVEIVAFQIYESFLIRAEFSFLLIIGSLLFSFFIGALSGVFPASQAAKLKPVEALRK